MAATTSRSASRRCDGSVLTCRFWNGRRRSSRSGPWSSVDTNGDGEIDTLETRDAARRIHGLTPISSETDTDDPSWTLNVADDLKNQYTDQFTLNFEREVARNLSVSASYIYKRAGNLFANIPINEVTGQEWDYERIPFTTSAGQQVMLYSVVFKDYNGDGVLDGDDVGVGRRQQHLARPEHAGVRWRQAQARVPGAPVRLEQALLGALAGSRVRADTRTRMASAGARSGRTSTSKRRCSMTTTGWEPQLHGQQPRGPAAVHAQVRAEAVGLLQDSPRGSRPRRPLPDAQRAARCGCSRTTRCTPSSAAPPGGVINPGGLPQIVGVDPNDPDYLPNQHLFDLHLERAFKSGRGQDASTSSSTGSTSSIRPLRSTWMCTSSTDGRVNPVAAPIPLRLALPVLTRGVRERADSGPYEIRGPAGAQSACGPRAVSSLLSRRGTRATACASASIDPTF